MSEYTVNLSLTVNPKIASITPTPSSVALDAITTGTSSDSKSTIITSENVSDIKITQIPSGFIVKNGSTALNVNESIGTGATLNVTISDINTLGNRSGTIKLTATASPNSEFSNGSANFVLNVNTSARVDGLPTSLNIDKTTITDSVNQYEAIPTAQKIQITAKDNLQSIVISGGNEFKYRVSATENGTYADSLTLDSSATVFWVKLMSTATQPQIKTTFIVSGVKSAIGASNPPNKSVVCTATVTPFTTTLNLNPTSVTETYEQDAVITAHQISVTQVNLSSIALTATGNYSISATENGSYGSSLTMTNSGTNFWVKLNSTSTAGSVTGKVTLVGSNTLGGGTTTKELNCSATINEVISVPDKLWIGFAKDASTFYSWYELNASESNLVVDLVVESDVVAWNNWYTSQNDLSRVISANTVYNPSFTRDGNFSAFKDGNGAFLSEYFSSYSEMTTAMETANIAGDNSPVVFEQKIPPGDRSAKWMISFIVQLDHTQFKFKDEDFYTSLMTEIGSSGQLAYAMITASPNVPNKSSLTESEKTKSYNNDFLRLKCGEVWNGDQTDGTKKAILKAKFDSSDNGSNTIATASYTAQVSSNTLLTSGTHGMDVMLFSHRAQFNDSNGNRPRIKYFYFETQIGSNLLKFSDSGTAQPQC